MRRTAALVTAGALVLLAGCQGAAGGSGVAAAPTPEAPPASVEVAPVDGSADVSPLVPLEISVTDGELTEVIVVDGAGTPVSGAVTDSPGLATDLWTPDTPLAYGTSYTLTATAEGEDEEPVEAATTFTTVTPAAVSTPSVGPLDGQTVGVGMPIRVWFDDPVVDKAAVESHLRVSSTTPTDGVWNWFSDTEVHFRPSQYWPENIQVTLEADLYGVAFGDGVWGEKDRTVSFSIGERHVSIADASTHTMEVYDGDQLVQSWPMSAGSPDNPSYNGPHVVTEMNRDRVMDSSTYGVPVDSPDGYRTPVEYAVRISDSGEFVHAAPWSVGQQGRANVSHGCINLSTDRAAWFFDFSQPGDVVEIRGSSAGTLRSDVYDWTIPWEEWLAGSALK
ncbi:L,D-transpeptidase [Geodermatophilus sabuli]|uniref:Peptidoglycan transpeptidase, ErfK-YbiS-YhnG family n=1 Tax=Geodermatophilus sabuli TaxID=1564158 RepID=A0A285E5P9_9ACTN|nr:Ig-like domain-containing protein [Geodermatophilus sabuli]MBB3082732.1 lipoprotein-anchoring transpeptidase ErfK/SrfK [Geodermatophilus sabuli]SNX94402.1 peptidoglycan transpeptidase precursor, ErfK-YbiS-YhnG family [Geodermatophilus sabuli]